MLIHCSWVFKVVIPFCQKITQYMMFVFNSKIDEHKLKTSALMCKWTQTNYTMRDILKSNSNVQLTRFRVPVCGRREAFSEWQDTSVMVTPCTAVRRLLQLPDKTETTRNWNPRRLISDSSIHIRCHSDLQWHPANTLRACYRKLASLCTICR